MVLTHWKLSDEKCSQQQDKARTIAHAITRKTPKPSKSGENATEGKIRIENLRDSSQPDILTQLWNQIITWVRTMQNNNAVKEAELGIGGLMVLVSVIGFCWPGKKNFYAFPSVGR